MRQIDLEDFSVMFEARGNLGGFACHVLASVDSASGPERQPSAALPLELQTKAAAPAIEHGPNRQPR